MGETNPQALTQSAAGPSPHALRARAKKPIVFGKYELLSRYRVGGMAEVWTAKRLGTGGEPTLIAIKRILPSFTDEADYLAMFRDEARLGEKLTHPNIAATHEIGQVDDHPYIALEHVRGQNVAALIRKAREQEEPVPASMALRIAIDVCRALEHAHSLADEAGNPLEIVHRDVSPTNILLGYDGAVKLIDFGIAKSNDQLMRTQAGLLKGKHGYLSPEQAAGEPVDARSDLFSLAICIWEMLAAKRLFLGASDFSSIARVREAVVPPLTESGASGESGAEAALESGLQRALSRDRDARYASATELREALEQASGEGVAIATDAELATYLKEMFADEIALEASDDALEAPAPYEGTGLLDAFDDLEPVSTVSTLAVMPDAPDEPVASDSEEDIDEDLDLMEVSSQTAPEGESFELGREPEADTESDDTPVEAAAEAADTDTTGQHEAPVFDASSATVESSVAAIEAAADEADEQASAADADPDTQTVDEPVGAHATPVETAAPAATEAKQSGEDDEEQADEPTRVVAYRSVESGELSAAQAPAPAAGEASLAAAATMPGMGGVEWDDEELSTHLYDGPSAAIVPLPGSASEASEAESASSERSSVPPFAARPSVAPFSSRPGAPQFVLRPSGAPASVPPPAIAPVAPTTQRPAAQASPPWLLPALIVATVVIGTIAFSMLRSATPGTIHLTTQPPDAAVTFDGRKVESTLSPFVIGSVVPGERHAISVSRAGYRTWQTQLVVGDGQTLQLPEVVLVPNADLPKPVAVAAPVAKVEEPEAPTAPKKPEVARVEPREPRTQPAPAPAPSRSRIERPAPSVATTAPAPARPAPPAVAAPPVVAGSETGMLRVNSRPWAQVHVDGRLVGNTPQMALRLSPGKHTVLLLNPELKVRKTFTVQIKRGSVTTKIVELL